MRGLDHIKRMSKKADVDRAWLDYYTGRQARRAKTFQDHGRRLRTVTIVNMLEIKKHPGWDRFLKPVTSLKPTRFPALGVEVEYHNTKGYRRPVKRAA